MPVSDDDFASVVRGLEQAIEIVHGRADPSTYRIHYPKTVDVRATRKRLHLTQQAFAARFGFSVGAVRDWEQGRRKPEASARVLLTVIDKEPEAVERALSAA